MLNTTYLASLDSADNPGQVCVWFPFEDPKYLTPEDAEQAAARLLKAAERARAESKRAEAKAAASRKADGLLVAYKTPLVYAVRGYDPETARADNYRVKVYDDGTPERDDNWWGIGAFGLLGPFTFIPMDVA